MPATFRAAAYDRHGGPEVITLRDLPRAEPGPGEVRIRLAAAGVSPIDWKLRAGHLAAHFTLPFPKIPGRDGAGVIEAAGPGVAGLAPGTPVAAFAPAAAPAGTHAETLIADAALTVPLPPGLGAAEAAALAQPGLSAWIAVMRTARVRPGQRVLVQGGAGAVGGLIVQLCAALGAEVTAVARAANADYTLGLGAARAVAYDAPMPALPPQDVVFDLMGGAVHAASYPLLARGGHLVWLTAAPITDRAADFGVRTTRAPIADDAGVLAQVLALGAAGILKPQIAATLPLAKAAASQSMQETGRVTRGRLILDCAAD
jgi:NADPH:quinone reductase-like Zn-dependent oxidoreductase